MKKCKSIGRAKGFEGCGVLSNNRQNGLCPACLYDWMDSTEAGKLYKVQVFDPRVKRLLKKQQKEKDAEMKINLTNWRPKLQSKVQEIARLIDIGLPCLALGYHAGKIQGGHVWAKGSNTTQSLNLHNIHRQSAQSNHSHNDDGLLREKLAEEYGNDYLEFVRGLKSTPTLHWNNLDYHAFYKLACEIANDLKMKGRNFDLNGRIQARNEINSLLGIYEKKQCIYDLD